ncbi:MAG: hypothetical protein A3D31_18455 [Candidatus Fluviicola riflensis]|nr:MAG: hypothetical protein CHH17_03705 [Candidatus Fluviicola riflensis]OGS76431.1 MAG: hypothetical protein A3D31_18455 [Candidatus Fluviicola riflensis]OGS82725.1 MAG: hypothetical protein A2724_13280 [Fluviicola sp. RIFCSPHIGHO2_01_FULL_43_53]OGS89024.1 MAG: hypothetical protein A3E30_16940 [Fluviicola sp. RIFCSPHIGHO2_12_FULL_43_24]
MKYINILHYFLTIGLIITVIVLLLNQNKIQNQLSDDSVIESVNYPFEERNMTLILTLIGVGFGLFALFTFGGVKQLFDAKVEEVNERYNKAKKDNETHHKRMNRLEKDLNYQLAEILYDKASTLRSGDSPSVYVMVALAACEKYTQVLSDCEDENQKFIGGVNTRVSSLLDEITKVIGITNRDVETSSIDFDRFKKRVERISAQLNSIDFAKFNHIVSKIKIID